MLSDVHKNVLDQLMRTETTETIPDDVIHMAMNAFGESTKDAIVTAKKRLSKKAIAEEQDG